MTGFVYSGAFTCAHVRSADMQNGESVTDAQAAPTQPALFDTTPTPNRRAKAKTPWDVIQARLKAAGHMTETGATRRARARHCHHCGTPVIHGLDSDVAALEIVCDPKPLTPLAEALATIAGRRTAELVYHGGRLELLPRYSWRIAGHPAGSGDFDVLAEHLCGTRPDWPTTTSVHLRDTTHHATPAGPPPY